MEHKQILSGNKKLFYRVKGEGPLVVLVHGFAEEGSIWDRQFDALTGYKLVIPDLPGSGRSEMIDDMSMEGLADSLVSIIRS